MLLLGEMDGVVWRRMGFFRFWSIPNKIGESSTPTISLGILII